MQLDLATVLFLHPLSLLVGAVCFLYTKLHSRSHIGLGKMAFGFAILGSGSILAGLGERSELPYGLWTYVSFCSGPVGCGFFWLGLRNLIFEKRSLSSFWVALLVVTLMLCVFLSGAYLINLQRAALFLSVVAAFSLANMSMLLLDPVRERLVSRLPLAGMFGFKACIAVLAIVTIAFPEDIAVGPAFAFSMMTVCQFGIALFVLIFVQERVERRLIALSEVDSLTRVHNRHWLHDRLPAVVQKGDAFVAIDIDFFKSVNDRYGHAAGDHVLVVVAERMQAIAGENALFARMGGEEFGLFVPADTSSVALAVAEMVRRGVQTLNVEFQGARIPLTISLGVAVADKALPLAALLRSADEALYDAKRQGRDRAVITSVTNEVSHLDHPHGVICPQAL